MSTSSDPKIPLRGIAALFDHLDPGVKAKLASAFGEAEDLMDFHALSTIDKQDRRKLSGLIASPVLTTATNNRGFDVSWRRLDDRRISSYEVQVSFSSNFSNPDSYNIVDTSLSLEGIGTTVYVRVRGVRFNGDCGPWSDTATIDAFATSAGPVVYTRGLNDIPAFYIDGSVLSAPGPIQHLDVTPQRINGGILVFGSCNKTATVRLNGSLVTNSNGGGFGPVFLTHGSFNFSKADNVFPSAVVNAGAGIGTFTGWSNLLNAAGTMETDYSNVGLASTDYFQEGLVPGQSLATRFLRLSNFGLAVPGGNTIVGIAVTFTGGWFGGDVTKSIPSLRALQLIDGGTPRTFSQTTDFPWPGTGTFNYTSPPASGAIPFVTFGGVNDLWGEVAGFWTPAKVNAANFGVQVQGRVRRKFNDVAGDQRIWMYGMTTVVYSISPNFVAHINVFTEGPLLNLTLNVIEFGEELVL